MKLVKNDDKTAEQLIMDFGIEGEIEVILHDEEDTWFGKALATLNDEVKQ